MKEKWIDITDKYQGSSTGHIRNKKTRRVLHEFVGSDGYIRTQFDGKTQLVHRAIAKAFIPKIEGKDFVNHIDGNKQNNSVANLEWCTRSENLKHAYSMNLRSSVGTKNSRCKLTDYDVAYIKANYIPKDKEYGAKELARRFGVAHQTICAVASGQNWNYKKENINDTST